MQSTPANASRDLLGRLLALPNRANKSGEVLWAEVLQVDQPSAAMGLLDLLAMMQKAILDLKTLDVDKGQGVAAATGIQTCCQQFLQSGMSETGEQLANRVHKTAVMHCLEIADLRSQMSNVGLAAGLRLNASESITKLDEIRAEIEEISGLDEITKRNLRVVLAHVQDALRQYSKFGWGAVDSCLRDLLAFLRQNYPQEFEVAKKSSVDGNAISKLTRYATKKYAEFHVAKPILTQLPPPTAIAESAQKMLDAF